MNRFDLRELAEARLTDATVLLGARRWAGAYYLAGYAIECGLKACIAKGTNQDDFPVKARVLDSYSHDIAKLVGVAGILRDLQTETENDGAFSGNWGVVSQWTEESRYTDPTEQEARELMEAISDPEHGAMRWLRTKW